VYDAWEGEKEGLRDGEGKGEENERGGKGRY